MKLITHAKSEVPLDTMKQVTYFTGEILEELLQDCIKNPAVRAEYDDFMLLCKLARDSEE